MAEPLNVWRVKFLIALSATMDVRVACEEVGVDLSTVYRARRRSPKFKQEWQEALIDGLEAAACQVAVEKLNGGLIALLLKAYRPERYGDSKNPDEPDTHVIEVRREDE